MRILIISAAFPPTQSGEATNAFYLSQHLADRGFEVHVLTSQNNTAVSDPRIKVHAIMRNWSWLEVPRLIKSIRCCHPDTILLLYIGWIYKSHPMITFAPTLLKHLLPSVPFVTRFEFVQGPSPSKIFRALRKGIMALANARKNAYEFGTLLHASDCIIVLSDVHRALLSEHFQGVIAKSVLIPPPPNIRIVPDKSGLARQEGRKIFGANDGHFVIAYIGYIYPTKGLESLLRAFRIICDQESHVRLALIGGNISSEPRSGYRPFYAEELADMAKKLGIDDKIVWTGAFKWDSDEVSWYLRAADVCVLPFDNGVQLNNSSFASAASYGLPIITTSGEMLESPFVHKKNVFLCPPKSPEAIAAAIKAVMDSSELKKLLSHGSLDLAQQWFSWNRAIERTLAVLGLGDQNRTSKSVRAKC
jgi:polysaccharide biosynthesis protein PslF